jgi:hypothetical protein
MSFQHHKILYEPSYSVSVVCIIGQFLKVDSTSLEARTAAGSKGKICSHVLCCYRMK